MTFEQLLDLVGWIGSLFGQELLRRKAGEIYWRQFQRQSLFVPLGPTVLHSLLAAAAAAKEASSNMARRQTHIWLEGESWK